MLRCKDFNRFKGKLSVYNCFVREEREVMKKLEDEVFVNDVEI